MTQLRSVTRHMGSHSVTCAIASLSDRTEDHVDEAGELVLSKEHKSHRATEPSVNSRIRVSPAQHPSVISHLSVWHAKI